MRDLQKVLYGIAGAIWLGGPTLKIPRKPIFMLAIACF